MTVSHNDDIPEDRQAIAPYNFVPLPPKVVPAEKLPSQDRYHEHSKTGRIVCTLTTESPLFVRCGLTPTQFATWGTKRLSEMSLEEQQQYAQFFSTERTDDAPGAPVIPGSSLRGMLRTLVEIAGYGKLTRVTERKLFYRSLGDPALRDIYSDHFIEDCRSIADRRDRKPPIYRVKIRTGFLRKHNGSYVIEECSYARIDQYPNNRGMARIPKKPSQPLYETKRKVKTPNWTYQHTPIYVVVDDEEQDYHFPAQYGNHGRPRHPEIYLRFRGVREASFDKEAIPDTQNATLVLTGPMQHKHLEFVFLHNTIATHPVSEAMIERFHDDDQITKWQEKAFPQNKSDKTEPNKMERQRAGALRNGEPVFFLLDEDQHVTFLGRAQMFRLPYPLAPLDFVPSDLRSSDNHDLAEAIFGYVQKEQQSQDQACAGRVFVGDAVLAPAQAPEDVWLSAEPFAPHILASPKPTTFQHYLVQPDSESDQKNLTDSESDQKNLKHYASTPETETTIRGHKRYWHRGSVTETMLRDHAFYHETPNQQQSDTQHTRLKPVKAGVTFRFDIHFENLSAVELGALLWVLNQASGEHRLSLGMGKPLGMGAIEITYEVEESLRKQRYTSVFAEEAWANPTTTLSEDRKNGYVKQFSDYVLNKSGEGKQVSTLEETTLEETTRIRCLLAMLRWPGLSQSQTRYMEIERSRTSQPIQAARCRGDRCNEYAERPVLPGPLQMVGEMPSYQHHHASNADEESSTLEPIQVTPDQHGVIETLATDDQFGYVEDTDGKRYPYLVTDVAGSLDLHQHVTFRVEKRKIAEGNGKKRREKWRPCAVALRVYTA
ncbi:MAG: hypothetical protein GFH25_541182n21 [Chloroflexi bacterium AL-N10]|nr:hypothetical protein [Chloroflexi bacterium AL-N10]